MEVEKESKRLPSNLVDDSLDTTAKEDEQGAVFEVNSACMDIENRECGRQNVEVGVISSFQIEEGMMIKPRQGSDSVDIVQDTVEGSMDINDRSDEVSHVDKSDGGSPDDINTHPDRLSAIANSTVDRLNNSNLNSDKDGLDLCELSRVCKTCK